MASVPFILVVAPPSLFRSYNCARSAGVVTYACRASEVRDFLSSREVAAVVCHDTSLDAGTRDALQEWYRLKSNVHPLLVLVTDLAGEGNTPHPLLPFSSLVFSCYHSRPSEVLEQIIRTSLPRRAVRTRRSASVS